MTRVAIIGATGYAGAELVRILSGHPQVELTLLTSRQYAGTPFDQIYPAMSGLVNLVCQSYSPEGVCEQADIIFTALPHKLPMEIVPSLMAAGKKVIDLSADFRFSRVAAYEAHYQPHTATNLLSQAVYGLCEVYAKAIAESALIGNPGCYPTSVLLPLIPLIRDGLISTEGIICDSKSGVSGAGRGLSLTTHFCEVNESYKAYKVGVHRHTPEMEEVLSRERGVPVSLTFVPHLVPMSRGMLTTSYATLSKQADEQALRQSLNRFYQDKPFVRMREPGRFPDTLQVRGTNYCDIGLKVDAKNQRVILISAIDNLVKGAAGQAVQNMNLMLGIDEQTGLSAVPFPI